MPFDQVPGRWAEVAERVDRHEQLRLVREGDASPLLVMSEADFDQAVAEAAELALCREAVERIGQDTRPMLAGDPAVEFLKGIAGRE
jgi:hypothetical protein